MAFRMLFYVIQESLRSLKRNGWLNFAAAGTTAVSLLVLGIAILLMINTNNIASTVVSNVEIVVYAEQQATEPNVQLLQQQLQQVSGVQSVDYISKKSALNNLSKQFGPDNDLGKSLAGDNPLPDTFRVHTASPGDVTRAAKMIQTLPEVDKVQYGQGWVEKLFKLTFWVRVISVSVMGLLGICAIFLIATTIRLTMFARRREIGIMKYVGATDWFVRGPFLLEGIILGGGGALTATLVLMGAYVALIAKLQEAVTFLPLVREPNLLLVISGGILASGIVLGVIGSLISVRRYLKV